jgi:hypothetical protein
MMMMMIIIIIIYVTTVCFAKPRVFIYFRTLFYWCPWKKEEQQTDVSFCVSSVLPHSQWWLGLSCTGEIRSRNNSGAPVVNCSGCTIEELLDCCFSWSFGVAKA